MRQNLSDSEFGREAKKLVLNFYTHLEFLLEIESKETE